MRLIDADALFKAFERTAWYDNTDRDEVAEEILLQMPTIDAVPVVRCKDCIVSYCHSDDDFVCGRGGVNVNPDDFCSYGKRRTIDE